MSQPTPFTLFLAVLFAPLVWMIYARFRAQRRDALALEGKAPEPLMDAAPDPQPNFFLRPFEPPQRAYLRWQWISVKTAYKPLAWISFVLLSANFMPQLFTHNDPALHPALIWESYLDTFSFFSGIAGLGGLVFGLMGVSNLGSTSFGRFALTRPFSLRFLYWANVGPMLTTLCVGLLTGVLLSFLFLLIAYGPIWQSLPHNSVALAALRRCYSSDDVQSLLLALQSSLPRLILSLVTTSVLAFSLATAFLMQPVSSLRKPVLTLPILLLLVLGSAMHNLLIPPHIARLFFFYSTLGPPPPYVFAIVTFTSSAVLLLAAERFMEHSDA